MNIVGRKLMLVTIGTSRVNYTLTLKRGNLAIQQEFCNVKFDKLQSNLAILKSLGKWKKVRNSGVSK